MSVYGQKSVNASFIGQRKQFASASAVNKAGTGARAFLETRAMLELLREA
jgi:hypothetical protein